MEVAKEDPGAVESGPLNASCWPSDFMEKVQSVSLVSHGETSNFKEAKTNHEVEGSASWSASQTLWATGMLSEPISDGFYCVILERKLKVLFDSIPSPDELNTLDSDGLKAEVIIVNGEKDKTLSMLKQLIATLVKGVNSNPAAIIKKIAGLVCDFYKWPNSDLSPGKAALEKVSHATDNQGVLMLGQIRHGSCRARAILFKVLSDTVGLNSKLLVGLPRDGPIERTDLHKHMSVIVDLNSMELLVDLVCFPGKLVPSSSKAILMSHIYSTGESDFAESGSCSSPREPNSPLCGFSERLDVESAEQDASLHSLYQCKLEASLLLRPKTIIEGKPNFSHTEPNIADTFWQRSRKKVIAKQEQWTNSSSPDHPLSQGHVQPMLGGDKPSVIEYGNGVLVSRSVGSLRSETRRRRRRSISMAPEIGDDIVRAVRAMHETSKRDRLLREQADALMCSSTKGNDLDHEVNVSNYHPDDHDNFYGQKFSSYGLQRIQYHSEKAISLPSSPHKFIGQAPQRSKPADYVRSANMISTWNEVQESSKILDNLFLPYQEWNIDFTELTVETRVGIGFFGEVFRGIWNGTDVAIKVFLEQDLSVENIEDFCNEISILSRVRHPNGNSQDLLSSSYLLSYVILFLGACSKPPCLSMVTEYMDMGSLYHLIHVSGEKDKLSWGRRRKMLCDICRGLMCIHRMKIVHRDLKSANCLVNKHLTVKICDFGLSRVLTTTPMQDSSSAGTPEWMAPELIRNEPYTEKCDIFSLGVIIWELFTLKRPWKGLPAVEVVCAVANDGARLEIPEGPLGKIIADCWAEPNQRPGCEEILSRLLGGGGFLYLNVDVGGKAGIGILESSNNPQKLYIPCATGTCGDLGWWESDSLQDSNPGWNSARAQAFEENEKVGFVETQESTQGGIDAQVKAIGVKSTFS